MQTKLIVEFFWECGRQGSLGGLFVCTQQQLDSVLGKEVYFGEVLGKHSEVYGTVEPEDIKILSKDQEFIAKFIEIIGDGTISGYNPLDYYEEIDEENEEE